MSRQKNSLHLGLALAVSVLLLGCQGVAPEALRRLPLEKTLSVQQLVKWKLGFWDVTLANGIYVGKFEDDDGTYYLGPTPCIYMSGRVRAEPPVALSFDCGIFVSNAPDDTPVVLMVNGTNREHTALNADGSPDIRQVNLGRHAPVDGKALDAGIQASAQTTINSMPNAGIVGGAVGGAIGAVMVAMIVEADKGRISHFRTQPPDGWLARALKTQP